MNPILRVLRMATELTDRRYWMVIFLAVVDFCCVLLALERYDKGDILVGTYWLIAGIASSLLGWKWPQIKLQMGSGVSRFTTIASIVPVERNDTAPITESVSVAAKTSVASDDPWLHLFRARQELEAELQKLIKKEEAGIKIVPVMKIGKDESDYRKERIERLKRDIEDLTKRMVSLDQGKLETTEARGKTTLNRDWPGDWRLMEDGFRRHSQSSVRATWQRASYGPIENWMVHGDHQYIVREIEAFCIQSGKLLKISPMSPPVSAQLLAEPSDRDRWLYFLKEKQLLSDISTGSETVDGETYAVTIGEINKLAMVSASVCVECASMAFTS